MKNKRINIDAVSKIAKALAGLKDQMVFVGVVVSLYANMESDEELRETYDVDITSVKVVNYSNYTYCWKDKFIFGTRVLNTF